MRTSMPRYALALALFAASGLTYSANAASAESHDQTHDERQPTASSAAAARCRKPASLAPFGGAMPSAAANP